jgi:hypothetical protein
MPFNPDEPFEIVDQAEPAGFDPDQPFEIVDETQAATPPTVQQPVPVGSTNELQKAVSESATIGKMRQREEAGLVSALPSASIAQPSKEQYQPGTFRPKSLLVQQADLYLGRPSAEKFQKLEETNFNPEVPIDLTPDEQKLFVDYRVKQGRRIASNVLSIPAGIAVSRLPGGQTLGGEIIGGAAVELARQFISPDEFEVKEVVASAVPTLGLKTPMKDVFETSRPGSSVLKNLLKAETGVGQQSSRLAQIAKETTVGGATGLAQGMVSSAGDKDFAQDSFKQMLFGGALMPTFSGISRGIAAASRGGWPTQREFWAELNRPYAQQLLQERAQQVQRELGPGGGINPAMAEELANALYSPDKMGKRPEDIRNWTSNVQRFLQDSLASGTRRGLSGDALIQEVVGELQRVADIKSVDPALVSKIVYDAEDMMKSAKGKVDLAFAERNAELIAAARRAEGDLQLESEYLKKEIVDLSNQRNALPATDQVERARIESEMAEKARQIKDIEDGFDPSFGMGRAISQKEAGTFVGEQGNRLLKDFKKVQNEGYGKLSPELEAITVQVPTGRVDEQGNEIVESFTVQDLRKKRTEILDQIDFTKPVQQAKFEKFQELEDIERKIQEGLDQNPALRDALKAQNQSYREGITRFKGAYINRFLRETGEAGGGPESIVNLIGPSGGTALELIKRLAGNEWEGVFKPVLSDFVYNKLRKTGQTPDQFLSLIAEARAAKGTGLSKEVANEFFPQLTEIQNVAEKYRSLIDRKATLESQRVQLDDKMAELQSRIDAGDKAARGLLNEVETKLAANQKEIDRLNRPSPDLGPEFKEMDDRTRQVVDALSTIKEAVKSKRPINLDDDQLKAIMSNPDARRFADDLKLYVQEQAKQGTDFQRLVRKSIDTGNLYGDASPEDIVRFLTSPHGELKQRYVTDQFFDVIKNNRPELLGDVQNFIVGNILKESVVPGKREVDIEKMRNLIADKYNPLINSAFGKTGVDQLNKIADQLSQVTKLDSMLSRKIIPAVTSAVAAVSGANFYGRTALVNILSASGIASAGKSLRSPEYLRIVSTPIDALEKAQMDNFNRRWPKLLSLETDRYLMREEDRKESEQVLRETQRQMRRRD